jgi:SAM-dependent methyltransferase
MILSATLSKPSSICTEKLGRPYIRIKIKPAGTGNPETLYYAEFFTQKQAFHKTFTAEELNTFLEQNAGTVFLNCVYQTETEEISILGNKKGHITRLCRKLPLKYVSLSEVKSGNICTTDNTTVKTYNQNRVKNYILKEGTPIPFLIYLGIMNPEGKIAASKYDKFRQINRFLEYIDDILPEVLQGIQEETSCTGPVVPRPVRIADFGCGKSYLTFAIHYYLTEIKKIDAEITGLDLKKDVIRYCNELALQFGCKGLTFAEGNIAEYKYKDSPDIVITLHACDTATDYALGYAVKQKVKAILSVPCCQHEINQQIDEKKAEIIASSPEFSTLLKYGIIKERFAALATDALRAEYLENAGYSVQILEFIDMEHTPKNLLIRAVLKTDRQNQTKKVSDAQLRASLFTDSLHVSPTLRALLQD